MEIILTLTLITVAVTLLFSIKNGISPNISSREARKAMISLIEKEGTVIDCGSGWGTLLFSLCRERPHCSCIGIENSPVPLLVSRLINCFTNSKIRFIRGDIYKADLSEADTVLCYLYPKGMKRFSSEAVPRLKPGCVIISNYFALPNHSPEKTVELNDIYRSRIYRYINK